MLIHIRLFTWISIGLLAAASAESFAQKSIASAKISTVTQGRQALAHFKDDLRQLNQCAGLPPGGTAAIAHAAQIADESALQQAELKKFAASLNRANTTLKTLDLKSHYHGVFVADTHIDLSWLWPWSETKFKVIPDTFKACLSYLDEYSEFCFTQSSPAQYQAASMYPELWSEIKKYVQAGRWEIVGGRWCEGDTNMLSPEAAVRQFLLGQKFYQESFGKTAVVGFEPDTFGHSWSMPQLLRQAGLRYYYFMRAEGQSAKGPLYWWEGPDGSRVLTFDAGAIRRSFIGQPNRPCEDLALLNKWCGAEIGLSMFGVGNHGGEPSRQMIQTCCQFIQNPLLPGFKFGTLEQFFHELERHTDLSKLPAHKGELNPIFSGCYTSRINLKQRLHRAEYLTQQAETLSLMAKELLDLPYPVGQFDQWWKDICWGHHHDTICGTSKHLPHEYHIRKYDELLADVEALCQDRLEHLRDGIKPQTIAGGVLAVNTLAWPRSAVVELEGKLTGLASTDGQPAPLQSVGGKTLALLSNLPSMGLAQWGQTAENPAPADVVQVAADGSKMESQRWTVTIDRKTGRITSLIDRQTAREWVQPGASLGYLRINHEYPGHMNAWEAYPIFMTNELVEPASITVEEAGPVRGRVVATYHYGPTTVAQHYLLESQGLGLKFETRVDWRHVGTETWRDAQGKTTPAESGDNNEIKQAREQLLALGQLAPEAIADGVPQLTVGFRLNQESQKPVYEIPFGDVTRDFYQRHSNEAFLAQYSNDPAPRFNAGYAEKWRPANHAVLLNWMAWGNDAQGAGLLTQEPHGVVAATDEVSLVLLRCTLHPDPDPVRGRHVFRYAFIPYQGALDRAQLTRQAFELNQPVAAIAMSAWPLQKLALDRLSLLSVEPPNMIVTSLKQSAVDSAWVMRAYNCAPGAAGQAALKLDQSRRLEKVDLLERPLGGKSVRQAAKRSYQLEAKPYEIQTYRLGK